MHLYKITLFVEYNVAQLLTHWALDEMFEIMQTRVRIDFLQTLFFKKTLVCQLSIEYDFVTKKLNVIITVGWL